MARFEALITPVADGQALRAAPRRTSSLPACGAALAAACVKGAPAPLKWLLSKTFVMARTAMST